eukprot:COSAG02_NODE_21832_length_773_cov_1.480712_2_plen_184_part_00
MCIYPNGYLAEVNSPPLSSKRARTHPSTPPGPLGNNAPHPKRPALAEATQTIDSQESTQPLAEEPPQEFYLALQCPITGQETSHRLPIGAGVGHGATSASASSTLRELARTHRRPQPPVPWRSRLRCWPGPPPPRARSLDLLALRSARRTLSRGARTMRAARQSRRQRAGDMTWARPQRDEDG